MMGNPKLVVAFLFSFFFCSFSLSNLTEDQILHALNRIAFPLWFFVLTAGQFRLAFGLVLGIEGESLGEVDFSRFDELGLVP